MSLRDPIHRLILQCWELSSIFAGLVASVVGFGATVVIVLVFLERRRVLKPDSALSVVALLAIVVGVFLLFLGAFTLGRRSARRRRERAGQ